MIVEVSLPITTVMAISAVSEDGLITRDDLREVERRAYERKL